jgi:methyl-accepting chemotaxis protein
MEADAERKAGMLRLADNFEVGIKGIVASVASQSTEMQSAADGMTHTAQLATRQAAAAAASVERASANVQTVASSAEELSALGAGDCATGGSVLEDRRPGGG